MPSAEGRGGLSSRGDSATPQAYVTTVGEVVESKGIGRNLRELADSDEQNKKENKQRQAQKNNI